MEKRRTYPFTSLERKLFHGTVDEKTVRCICHQNFDPRVHGVRGTAYGKGAYFATTSRYSHSYTKPISHNGSRYMFLARILVGQSVHGKPEFQRPPPVDPKLPHGALYDSCVNDESRPTIFVIFNAEQCYPEFLIEYRDLTPISDDCDHQMNIRTNRPASNRVMSSAAPANSYATLASPSATASSNAFAASGYPTVHPSSSSVYHAPVTTSASASATAPTFSPAAPAYQTIHRSPSVYQTPVTTSASGSAGLSSAQPTVSGTGAGTSSAQSSSFKSSSRPTTKQSGCNVM
jgi:hypothetical protein